MPKKQQPINVPKGEIIEDLIKKNKWKVGDPIAEGGFGAVYEVNDVDSKNPYVVKFEPFKNDQLHIEEKFYTEHLNTKDMDIFKKNKNIKTVGLPCFIASGSHEVNDRKLRFLIMEKLGKDLGTISKENSGTFPTTTVFKIAIQLLDVLEYIHERGYVHADIKAKNVLMGISEETKNKQVYLVDFGLCSKFSQNETFSPNRKNGIKGTLEYLSRDAYLGVPTRRGDLEILAYNIIEWLGCILPWKTIKSTKYVYENKQSYMSDISKFMKDCFGNKEIIPNALVNYLEYLNTLDFNTVPDYKKIKNILLSGVSKSDSIHKPLQFSAIGEKEVKEGTAANDEEIRKASVGTAHRAKIAKRKLSQNKKVVEDYDGPAKRTRLAVKKKNNNNNNKKN